MSAVMLTSTGTEPRYRIIEALGRGGMGEVCLAEDLILDREVALKFLTSDEGDALEQLLNEARAAAALDHPFICKIYEVTNLDGRPCIVMEYVRGETLERRLRRGPLPLDEGLRIAEEIAEALEAAHKRRLIHRDLKPANVMLTEDHHIKVMDFGLAVRLAASDADERTIAARAGEEGMLLGTPAYMAPEQIGGSPADRRADIFAFGIVLYETLSGVHPFRRTGIEATLAAIVGEIAPELHGHAPTIPIAVSEVVAKMLAKHPESRYQSFGDLRLDLRRLAGELTAPATVRPVIVEAPRDDERAPLFGRESERNDLLQAINRGVAGRGGLIVLAGEAGVGKSRLAEEALAAGRRLGCQTLVGRCYEQDGTPPLIPYIEVLEEAARIIPVPTFRQAVGRTAPELAKLLPELHRLFPDIPPAMELPPELRQRFLFTNVREFLTRCSSATPLVIFLDDLQWADESTLQLTQHLAQHLDSLPIVVIVGYRDVDVAAEPQQAGALNQLFRRVRGQSRDAAAVAQTVTRGLEQLVAQRLARMITLRPLSENDVRGLLGALGQGDPPPRLVRKFLDQTGGNPFFIEELFRNLSEEGRLFDGGGKWKRDLELNDLEVPSSVRLVIDRRLQRVSGETQNVLKSAAVIGQHFELDLLDAVIDVDEEALMTALEEAEQAHLLKGPSGRQERRWRFAHQLICQTLTGAVPQLRRQRLHVRIADAMSQLDAETYKSEIAHHLYSAGPMADATRTARALTTAGDAAHTMYATEDAVQHYRRAIEVLNEGGGDEATLLGVQERLADLLALLGDRGAAMEHYQALAAAHEKSGARVDRARQVRKIGALHWQGGDRTQAIQCYQRALGALDGMSAHIEAAHLYQELGLAAFRSGDNITAIAWAEGALSSAETALADSAGVTPEARRAAAAAIAHATNTIGVALARSGQLDAARERIEHSVNAAREHGLLDVACRGYANLGVLYSTVEPKRAIDVSLTGLELASKIGAASLQSYIYANLATAYCALTERCESEGLMAAQTAANLDRELGQLDHLAVPLIVMAQIYQCQGELERAQEVYREALALAEQMAEPQLQLPCYEGLATIYLDRGDRRLAEEYMEKGRVLCERTGIDPDTLLLLPFLC